MKINDAAGERVAWRLAAHVFATRVLGALVAYVSQIVLARWMGSREFGLFIYVWTWVVLLGCCIDLGMGSAAQRLIPQYAQHRQLALLRGFLSGSGWLSFAGSLLISAACALIVWAVQPWLDQDIMVPLYLACITLPAYALGQIQGGISRSYDWMGLALTPVFVIRQLLLIAVVSLIYAVGGSITASSAMVAFSVSTWVTSLGALVMLHGRLAGRLSRGPKEYDFSLWLSVSLPIFMVEGCAVLLSCIDVLMLKSLATANEVAIYYAAAKTLTLVSFIQFAFAATSTQRFSRHYVANEREELRRLLVRTIHWTFWPSLLAVGVLLAAGRPLVGLFGTGFEASYPLMIILSVGLLARAAVGPTERLLTMTGEGRICALIFLVAILLNVGLCLALAPQWNAAGVAAASSCAMMVESALLFVVARKRLGTISASPRSPSALGASSDLRVLSSGAKI